MTSTSSSNCNKEILQNGYLMSERTLEEGEDGGLLNSGLLNPGGKKNVGCKTMKQLMCSQGRTFNLVWETPVKKKP